jgi:hypothetical protein
MQRRCKGDQGQVLHHAQDARLDPIFLDPIFLGWHVSETES